MKKLSTLIFIGLMGILSISAQEVFYGDNYVVFEAEATSSSLAKWAVRKKGDTDYQKYVTTSTGIDPIFDTYLEYTGPWQGGADTELEYKFVCPKSGNYRMLMRMHQPLRDGELGDARNDVFVKMAGNFISATTGKTTDQLKASHKFWGRGVNKWGSCHKLEISNHVEAVYTFTEGEEYTLTMGGRSTGTCIDYILFYEYSSQPEIPQGEDVAKFFPPEYRPGLNLVDPTSIAFDADTYDLRTGTSMPLPITWQPENAKTDVMWKSSVDSIVEVDENGLVTAAGEIGEKATIIATSTNNGIADTCEVTIVEWYAVAVQGVVVSPENEIISEGSTVQLSAQVLPINADNKDIVWSSNDTAIATVDANGLVLGVGEGQVSIRATSVADTNIYDDVEVGVAELISASMAYDDEEKYKTTEYVVGETLPVSIDYHAGTFNTVTEVKVWLRHMQSGWAGITTDYLQTIPAGIVGSESGTLSIDIDLTGVTPSTDIPEGDFYFLFAKFWFSDGGELDKGIQPINIVAAPAALEENQTMEVILYPNPAKNYVGFNLKEGALVSVYSTSGKMILSRQIESNEQMDISSFSKGIYFVTIDAKSFDRIEKLVVN